MSPNVPGATRGKAQNKRPACALSAIFVAERPSTRGATAPQRAQQVNFVVRWAMCLRAKARRTWRSGGVFDYLIRVNYAYLLDFPINFQGVAHGQQDSYSIYAGRSS